MTAPAFRKGTGDDHAGTHPSFPGTELDVLPRDYAPGATLSRKYRLDALLGEGGMGEVWRATNLPLDLPVAIKLIRGDLDRSALRARLQLEARSAAKLGHPAIVRVFDVGDSEFGDPFIVMELLHGESIAQMLDLGRLSAARAVQLLLPIIDALSVAHTRGIVHRDLKPDNLFVAVEDERVQPKILDFGIAKVTAVLAGEERLTESGAVIGSPSYLSPEQARGRDDIDYRVDIWSLSVVLYEAITGEVPFVAPNYNALLRAIVEDEPKPIVDYAAGDSQLWEILKTGLAKDRRERHQSMAALGRALAAWLLSHGTTEDACGVSLEAKWCSRTSDPMLSGAAEARSSSSLFRPERTLDSLAPAPAEDSRAGAAQPKPVSYKRTVRVAGVLAALLAVLALVSFSSANKDRANLGPGHVAAQARAEVSPVPVAAAARSTVPLAARPSEPVVSIASSARPLLVDPLPSGLGPSLELTRQKPAASTARSLLSAGAGNTKAAAAAAPEAAPLNSAKPTRRELLAPY
ncbi:MAG TPA: protein kinase [Polyangiaceae bacterium]|jgi:serine/threonine protein kinase|nr:protein kinase [Polyangiaceae bacterium]